MRYQYLNKKYFMKIITILLKTKQNIPYREFKEYFVIYKI
jgi:hypothetical protein